MGLWRARKGDGFVLRLERCIRRLPVVPLVGGGRLQPVAVEQVARGVARALALPAAAKHAYDVGGPDTVTLGELVDLIAKALGRRRVLKLQPPSGVVRAAMRALHALPYFPLTPDQLLKFKAAYDQWEKDHRRPPRPGDGHDKPRAD